MRPDQARELAEIFEDENIGRSVAFIRQQFAKQNQSDFSKDLGLTRAQVAFIETGRTPINTEQVWRLCKRFNIHPDWIFSGMRQEALPRFDAIPPEKIFKLEKRMKFSLKLPFRQFWRLVGWIPEDNDFEEKKELTDKATSGSSDGVNGEWLKLKKQIQQATADTGKKTALAKFLRVDLTQLSKWLTDSDSAREPGAGYTLRMQAWVNRQKRQ